MWILNALSAAYCAACVVVYMKKGETFMAAIMAAFLVLNMVFVVRGVDMRLIDANAPELYRKSYVPQDWSGVDSYPTMVEWEDIENAPTIDAVPVVRCKDCINRHDIDFCPMYHIKRFDSFDVPFDATEDDGFCDRGERMDGEAE